MEYAKIIVQYGDVLDVINGDSIIEYQGFVYRISFDEYFKPIKCIEW